MMVREGAARTANATQLSVQMRLNHLPHCVPLPSPAPGRHRQAGEISHWPLPRVCRHAFIDKGVTAAFYQIHGKLSVSLHCYPYLFSKHPAGFADRWCPCRPSNMVLPAVRAVHLPGMKSVLRLAEVPGPVRPRNGQRPGTVQAPPACYPFDAPHVMDKLRPRARPLRIQVARARHSGASDVRDEDHLRGQRRRA